MANSPVVAPRLVARCWALGAALVACAQFVVGCTQPQRVGELDAPALDAASPPRDVRGDLDAPDPTADVPSPLDGGRDVGVAGDDGAIDGGADAGAADAGAPDAGAPDAPLDVGTDAPRTCDSIYGARPMYVLCAETATTCEFYSRTGSSCTEVCRGDGTCLIAYNEGLGVCERAVMEGCNVASPDRICVCTR